MISKNNQIFLLNLARNSIEQYLKNQERIFVDENKVDKELKSKQGTFVTLTIGKKLRGCIGHILPVQPIYKDIISNAISAAFEDSRFLPINEHELNKIKIEISVLSPLKPIEYKNADDLLKKINNKMGIYITRECSSAVFLPQVWEELPQKELFLSHLCLKAGLIPDFWQTEKLDVDFFEVQKFGE